MSLCIHPVFNGFYYSLYLKGLFEIFGSRGIRYNCRGFPIIQRHRLEQGYDLAFVIEDLKVFIDQQDNASLCQTGLAWCDVYGKVNLEPSVVPPEHAHKVLPIGPTFPVKLFGLPQTVWQACRNYLRARAQIRLVKAHFACWRAQWKYRLPETAYAPGRSEPDYVFFSATLWKQEAARCNEYRSFFIDACRSVAGLRFEGGFCQRWQLPGFEKYSVSHRPSHREYVEKTKRSTVVFNTPTVAGCHGWKLAEYLAMGKAIISLPPLRALPAPLVHGQQIHLVEPKVEAIREATRLILNDAGYRKQLEQGARDYYLKYLRPRSVIERLLEAARRPAAVRSSERSIVSTSRGR